MKKKIKIYTIYCLLLWTGLLITHIAYPSGNRKQPVELNNGYLKIVFDGNTGEIAGMVNLKDPGGVIVDGSSIQNSPWEITIGNGEQLRILNAQAAGSFSYRKAGTRLELKWSKFNELPPAFNVVVDVRLLPDSAMSVWNIYLNGIRSMPVNKVTFPRIAGIADMENEALAAPDWMGTLLHSPRNGLKSMKAGSGRYNWTYPGHMSMQFVALYNPERFGLYFSCNDSLAFSKDFFLLMDNNEQLVYGIDHFPSYNTKQDTYRPAYDCLVGVFRGDWITAAKIYKQWAVKQSWSRNSRLKNGKVPGWLQNTGYWEWNRGYASNVLPPAVSLQKRLGVPVSVLWHWWHGQSYDDSFPEFFPPRDGKKGFTNALCSAQQQGVKAMVYMNTLSWGTSTKSWQDLHAENYAVKTINGNIYNHVYNIFTKKAMTDMCDGTAFWRQKYASLTDTAVNEYGIDGIYMDQACLSMRCYNPAHGHPLGGGNYWVDGFRKKIELIRAGFPPEGHQILSGEGGGENWLPFLDAFLTLQVSKERYAGTGSWQTVPLFQAVYHEYGISFGNYSSLLSPPYDEKWPKEFAPADAETPLNPEFNQQFLMEQARSFVWGIQPMISNYQPFLDTIRANEIGYIARLAKVRQSGLKYFVHGEFMRPPRLAIPEENVIISKLSIYAGRNEKVTRFEKAYPEIYTAAWKSADNNLAVALASISKTAFPVNFVLSTADYGIDGSGEIFLHDEKERRKIGDYSNQRAVVDFVLPPAGICFIELTSRP